MKNLVIVNLILIITACQEVKDKVMNNDDRVVIAYEEKEAMLNNLFAKKQVNWNNFELFFRVFKQDEQLEIWAKSVDSKRFTLVKIYPFCTNSGTLGPKRKEGDRQIPEGFYTINRFNPKSSFYLSLGLNYPNASDLILSDKTEPGSDIFIHGACASVGCVSITDDKIKEVYLLANEAKKHGQMNIPVHVFPFKMTDSNIENGNQTYHKFWKNLKKGYDLFEHQKQLFEIKVDSQGNYLF
ncbi:MAG: murein L,D-transpeptidase family protein [Saprospiraceae bacterium]